MQSQNGCILFLALSVVTLPLEIKKKVTQEYGMKVCLLSSNLTKNYSALKKQLFLLFFLSAVNTVQSQVILNPNFGAKSHPTLHVFKVEKSTTGFRVFFKLVNKDANEDWFCVDRNTYLVEEGKKLRLQQTIGISNCPEDFKFTYKGQEFQFELRFPATQTNTVFVDLLEDCSGFCFRFNGLIVDSGINETIEQAFALYRQNKLSEAAQSFEKAVQKLGKYPYAIYVYNLVEIYTQLKDRTKVNEWKKVFESRDFADKQFYLDKIEKL